jgi:hypothetical protein
MLYYFRRISDAGTTALLAQRLDPSTKAPKGEPITVRTFGSRLELPTGQFVGYGLAGSRLILPLGESHLDVWAAEQEK